MTYTGKNVYFNVSYDIFDKYNNTVQSSIKMKPKDVTFVKYTEESNKKDPKFKVGDHVRISRYKDVFDKGYTPYKIQNTVPWTYLINYLNGEKELQKTDQKEFRIEKVIKKKENKLYVK